MKRSSSFGAGKIICLIIAIIILLFSIFQIFQTIEFSLLPTFSPETSSRTLEYNGNKYLPDNNVITVLLMGIDNEGEVEDSGSYRNTGLADFICLLAFDIKDKTCTILHLNRDTMTEINTIAVGGGSAGTINAQLALSHSYGNGLQESCINTKSAVSNLLYNIVISNYISVNMDGISILNDFVGGVPVTVQDDFSEIDPSLIKGETVTLNGKQALNFIRSRSGVSNQTNIERMNRQQQYMNAFYQKLSEKISEDKNSVSEIFNELDPYMVTDCNTGILSSFSDKILEYSFSGINSIEGETINGDDGVEFYPDAESLKKTVIEMFFIPE